MPLGDALVRIAAAVGHRGRLVPVPPARLEELGVQPWSGEWSLPVWLPEEDGGMVRMDTSRAERAGLRRRSLEETAVDTLADERARGIDRPRRAGLTRAEERELLALL